MRAISKYFLSESIRNIEARAFAEEHASLRDDCRSCPTPLLLEIFRSEDSSAALKSAAARVLGERPSLRLRDLRRRGVFRGARTGLLPRVREGTGRKEATVNIGRPDRASWRSWFEDEDLVSLEKRGKTSHRKIVDLGDVYRREPLLSRQIEIFWNAVVAFTVFEQHHFVTSPVTGLHARANTAILERTMYETMLKMRHRQRATGEPVKWNGFAKEEGERLASPAMTRYYGFVHPMAHDNALCVERRFEEYITGDLKVRPQIWFEGEYLCQAGPLVGVRELTKREGWRKDVAMEVLDERLERAEQPIPMPKVLAANHAAAIALESV